VYFRRQLWLTLKNTTALLVFLANSTGPLLPNRQSFYTLEIDTTIGSLVTLCGVIVLLNLGRVSVFRGLAEQWFVLVPIGAVLGMYALIHIEGRYIAAYVVVLWMVLFRSMAIPHSAGSKKIFTAVLACAALIAAITSIAGISRTVLYAARYFANGKTEAPFFQSGYTNWKVAKFLQNAGLRAGDPVGGVGWTYSAYWARMARVHVVTEVPAEGARAFWLSDTARRADVMRLFQNTGAKAVVAKSGYINGQQQHVWELHGLPGHLSPLPISASDATAPGGLAPVNWQHIGDTDYYVYVFRASGG
jgi:hypothetical protein